MTKADLSETILAYLRAASAPVSSRELASRFLLIRHDDESTCHRLLAPCLSRHASLEHLPGKGWIHRSPAAETPVVGPETGARGAPKGPGAAPDRTRLIPALRDFVALASEGAGPAGSGSLRVVSLQPVVSGEVCEPEHLPAWAAEEESDSIGPARSSGGEGGDIRTRATRLETADLRVLVEAVGTLPIVCHRVAREAAPLLRACVTASLPFHPILISLSKLGHHLFGLKPRHAPFELASALGLETTEPDDCRGRAQLMARCFLAMLPLLEEIGISTFDELQILQSQPAAPLDFSPYAFTADDFKSIPPRPGVYRFLDRAGEVLYIGKAKNLRSRMSSYFVPSARGSERGRAILERVHSFSFELACSELEALLNEAALLAELKPPLNRQFDVHQRPAPYGPRLNLAVVLPDCPAGEGKAANSCTIHLMQQGRYRLRVRGLRSVSDPGLKSGDRWRRLERAVRAIYFGDRESFPSLAPAAGEIGADRSTPPAGIVDRAGAGPWIDAGDVDWKLVASYLARNRDDVNVLDVDECDSPEGALASLKVLALAAVGGERVVAR